MGWTVYVAVERAEGLKPAEREAIVDHVARWNDQPWELEPYDLTVPTRVLKSRVLAHGAVKIPHEVEHPDVARLLEALSELRGLVPEAETRVADDLGLVGWSEDAGGFALVATAAQPEVRTPRGSSTWVSARSLVGKRPPRAAEGVPPAGAQASGSLEEAIQHIRGLPRRALRWQQQEPIRAAIEAVPPGERIQLADEFRRAWNQARPNEGLMDNLRAVASALAGESFVEDELVATVGRARARGEAWRLGAATALLQDTGSPRGLAAILAQVREYRAGPEGFSPPHDEDMPSSADLLMSSVSRWKFEPGTDAFASIALLLATPGADYVLAQALSQSGGAQALGLLDRVRGDWAHGDWVCRALMSLRERSLIDDQTCAERLRRWLGSPRARVRLDAAKFLVDVTGRDALPIAVGLMVLIWREGLWGTERFDELGSEIIELPMSESTQVADRVAELGLPVAEPLPLGDPLEDLVSHSWWVRSQGLSRLKKQRWKDERVLLPLVLYDELYRAMPAAQQRALVAFRDFVALPEELRRRDRHADRAAWIRTRATPADIAALPPVLRDIHDLGAAEVAGRYPVLEPPLFELTDSEREALEEREAAHLARFGF